MTIIEAAAHGCVPLTNVPRHLYKHACRYVSRHVCRCLYRHAHQYAHRRVCRHAVYGLHIVTMINLAVYVCVRTGMHVCACVRALYALGFVALHCVALYCMCACVALRCAALRCAVWVACMCGCVHAYVCVAA